MKLNIVNNRVSEGSTYGMGVANGTHYAFVNQSNGECILQRLPANEDETTFALLANLYVCEGEPGKVIKVHAKKRIGKLDFISCMQKALENQYKDKLVGKFSCRCGIKNKQKFKQLLNIDKQVWVACS